MTTITTLQFLRKEKYAQAVVGESNYQRHIARAFKSDGTYIELDLHLEDHNPFDGNAVAVVYEVDTVGYLPREDAVEYRKAIQSLGYPAAIGNCAAKITGGGEKHYGIVLDLDIQNLQIEKVIQSELQSQPAPPVPPPAQSAPAKISLVQKAINYWNAGTRQKIILTSVLLFVFCCCTALPFASPSSNEAGAPTAPTVSNDDVIATMVAATAEVRVAQTALAVPTNTPQPTATPLPPTAAPAPIVLQGAGDSVVDVSKNYAAAVAKITNQGGGNFAVWNVDPNGEHIDLLVNTIGSYQGTLPIDFMKSENTVRFEIKSSGNWRIEVIPLSQARRAAMPGVFQGNGDDVVIFNGNGSPDLLKIDASSAESNFAVWAYGEDRDLLVNEIAPYSGVVAVSRDAVLVVIKAAGPWSIEVTTK